MYFRVRNTGGTTGENEIFVNLSKTAKIEELKEVVWEKLNIEPHKQVLLYKGKQLVSEHKVHDYDIQLNDVVQLMTKIVRCVENENKKIESQENHEDISEIYPKIELLKTTSKYYEINDLVDVQNTDNGAWFEAKIIDIFKSSNFDGNDEKTGFTYKVQMALGEIVDTQECKFNQLRPRSYYTFKRTELKEKMTVLASYNIEDPTIRGYWYDFEIERIQEKTVIGTILIGQDLEQLINCTIKFSDEVMRIEEPVLLSDESSDERPLKIPLRKQPYNCNKCKDLPSRKCKDCGCSVCAGKDKPDEIIMCDECDYGYHLQCLTPPLSEVPAESEWYCPDCKNDENEIVKAGDKLKFSSKKAKLASNKEMASNRDWGKGMACVGRTKECTIVPKDHYGPVPGVEVGTCWKFRLQASEAGIHRPHVAGIHGRETDGAYSLVLSGGYEDDIDKGEEFYYTGSGGRDLSGNKRVNDQSSDQKLTRMNKALALNCYTKFNDKIGAHAKDWKAGKPVRVVRNYKLGKYSKFAPKNGNRYDGIYKVVKYYPEKGKSGFIVWRYQLKRDDPNPAPWAKGGQELEMIFPPGYLESLQAEQGIKEKSATPKTPNNNFKRKLTSLSDSSTKKKTKMHIYRIPKDILQQIKKDVSNDKLWEECRDEASNGKQKFLSKVEELFMCICCQELVYQPVTTECNHNICKSCLTRSFKSEIYTCPYCRYNLGTDYKLEVNDKLGNVLASLFPGYEASR